ncbi:hypothetical protein ABBQ38_001227 [Trebouxia sp. C0009 RCD-2024]
MRAMISVGASADCIARGPTASLSRCKKHAIVCRVASPHPQSWPRPQLLRRPTPACRAEERSRDSTKTSEAERLKAPDSPPAADIRRTSDEEASTSQAQTSDISDELRALQQRKREQSQSSAPTGYVQSILQEVRLIEWPTPKQALLNTVLVIGIVGASSVVLFAINSTLAELSKISYK